MYARPCLDNHLKSYHNLSLCQEDSLSNKKQPNKNIGECVVYSRLSNKKQPNKKIVECVVFGTLSGKKQPNKNIIEYIV